MQKIENTMWIQVKLQQNLSTVTGQQRSIAIHKKLVNRNMFTEDNIHGHMENLYSQGCNEVYNANILEVAYIRCF
jgi:hypothetical protein